MAGRPRSDSTRQAILDAALELVAEIGYRQTTVEGIAARAGAGKQTIYRWWRGKADVVLEATRAFAEREIPLPDTGSLRGDLRRFLTSTFAAARRPGVQPLLRALMAEAQLDATFAADLDELFLRHRRDALETLVRRYPDQRRDVPLRVAVEVVFGVMWYRILVTSGPLDAALVRHLVELIAR